MAIRIYNSLTRTKEDFKPIAPPKVSIYVCGPTVYNYLHVGNFRGPVFFNLVRNWLEYSNYKVNYIVNFTDVDDKIIEKAKQEGVEAHVISERYIAEYKKDFAALGLRPHDANPKVSDHMPQINSMIGTLIEKGKAYEMEGDVNYAIDSFNEYGKLSHRKTEDMLVGVRIDKSDKKKSPLDFALWKKAKEGEPSWQSPWGNGRPGWHIECSAMASAHFGDTLDIHGGGLDLLFPHHENEIAQSEGASGHRFVNTWMHWNLINISGQKMSKSLGNFITMREFLEQYPAEVYKWTMLAPHYRSVGDFSDNSISQAISGLARVYSAMAVAHTATDGVNSFSAADPAWLKTLEEAWGKVTESLNDDFNTPEAFAVVFDLVRQVNTKLKRGMKFGAAQQAFAKSYLDWMAKIGKIFSLFEQSPAEFLTSLDNLLLARMKVDRSTVESIIQERQTARAAKDFAKSDELRKKLTDMGISLSDLPNGYFWEVTK